MTGNVWNLLDYLGRLKSQLKRPSASKGLVLWMAFGEIKVESLKCEISDHYASKFPIKKRCHDDIVNQFRSFSGFSKEDHLNFLFCSTVTKQSVIFSVTL